MVAVENSITDGLTSEHEPMAAMGAYLVAAQAASEQLGRNPKNQPARDDYNFAVARIFTTIGMAGSTHGPASHCACRGRELFANSQA